MAKMYLQQPVTALELRDLVRLAHEEEDAFFRRNPHLVALYRERLIAVALPSPESGKIHNLYKSLLGTWVPGVITSVIGNILGAALGL